MAATSRVIPLRRGNGVAPNILKGKVPPLRRKNSEVRSREHLTPDEVEHLIAAAKSVGRHGHRDATLILAAYRHGLRVSELVALRWDMVDLKQGLLHVNRLKNGTTSTHPIRGPELRALRKLKRDYQDTPYLFVTERKGPLSTSAVRKIIASPCALLQIILFESSSLILYKYQRLPRLSKSVYGTSVSEDPCEPSVLPPGSKRPIHHAAMRAMTSPITVSTT